MAEPLRIVVIGAGDVGQRHLNVIASLPGFKTVGIVDPAESVKAQAQAQKIAYSERDYEKMLDAEKPDGVLIATPNALHLENGLACVARKLPMLMEKPITETVETAMTLVRAAAMAGVPILVGHHRRYNPLIAKARDFIKEGGIGTMIAVSGTWFRRKPDNYYTMKWRREPGGGPLLINTIHDLDCLRLICGDIKRVRAVTANMARGFAVEDTGAILIEFVNGALGTFILSDAVQGPWGWEQCAGENAAWYPQQPVDCYVIGGSEGSLTVPSLEHWWNKGGGGRADPIMRRRLQVVHADPHVRQWQHFGRVIRGEESPIVPGLDATRTLAVTLAVAKSATTGEAVEIPEIS